MIHKQRISLLMMIAIAVAIVYNGCNFYKPQQDSIHNHEKYKNISRAALLNACQSCHAEQHKNEQLGPHANAYKALAEHKEYVNSTEYNLAGYTSFVNQNFESRCVTCHAPENLFEDAYAGFEFLSMSVLSKMPTDTFFTLPKARVAGHLRGVDCLSCHYNGKDVLASKNFKEKKESRSIEGYCFPKPSAFLSSDLLCASCHQSNYYGKESFDDITSMNCNSCHTENLQGSATHYTYWKNRKKEVLDSFYYEGMIAGLKITSDKDRIYVQLKNTSIPHTFTDCRETKVQFEFRNKNKILLVERRVVLNQKDTHFSSIEIPQFAKEAKAASESGNAFEYNAEPITFEVDKAKHKGITTVGVSVLTKGQYWHDDSTGDVTIRKSYPIN
jgi:hypothetical protein